MLFGGNLTAFATKQINCCPLSINLQQATKSHPLKNQLDQALCVPVCLCACVVVSVCNRKCRLKVLLHQQLLLHLLYVRLLQRKANSINFNGHTYDTYGPMHTSAMPAGCGPKK